MPAEGVLCILFILAVAALVGYLIGLWQGRRESSQKDDGLRVISPKLDIYATLRQLHRWREQGRIAEQELEALRELARDDLTSVGVPRPGSAPAPGAVPTVAAGPTPGNPQAPAGAPTVGAPTAAIPPTSVPNAIATTTLVTEPTAGDEPIVDAILIDEASGTYPAAPATARGAAPPYSPATGQPYSPAAASSYPPASARPAAPMAARSTHPLDRPPEPVAPPKPSLPRRALAEVLQSFMEERNIRWGEIISGILIVVSAVGLIVSLRSTLQRTIPYFPALLFMLLTGAIHFAGIYSLRKWRLRSTSRGILVIGTLLVPLSFLAAILLAGTGERQRPATDPAFLVAVVVGLAGFGTMNWFASRALLRRGWGRLMAAVLGPSIAQLAINRLAESQPTPLVVTMLAAIPVASFLVAAGHLTWLAARRATPTERFGKQMLLEIGIGLYAAAVPLGLIVARAQSRVDALACLSPALSLVAAVLLSAGLVMHVRWAAPKLALLRMIGTSLALFGGAVMVGTVAASWPQPELLIAVGLLDFALLTALAIVTDFAALHTAAGVCLTVAYVFAFLRVRDPLEGDDAERARRLVSLFFTGQTSAALTAWAAVVGAASAALHKARRARVALSYGFVTAGIGALGLILALVAGFGRGVEHGSQWATALLALYGIGAAAAGVALRRPPIVYVATLVGWTALVHATRFNDAVRGLLEGWTLADRPVLLATVLHAGCLALLAAAAGAWRPASGAVARRIGWWSGWTHQSSWWAAVVLPTIRAAQVASVLAAFAAVWVRNGDFSSSMTFCLAIAVVWAIAAWLEAQSIWLMLCQAMSGWAVVLAVAAVCRRQEWWTGTVWDMRYAQALIAALGGWCAVGSLVRRSLTRVSLVARRFRTLPAAVDQPVAGVLVVALLIVAAWAATPGVSDELAGASSYVNRWEPWFVDSANLADGAGTWIALALVLAAVRLSLADVNPSACLAGLTAVSFAVPLLIAARLEATHAVASGLRWASAGWGVLWTAFACVPSRLRRPIERLISGESTRRSSPLFEGQTVERDLSVVGMLLGVVGVTTAVVMMLANHVTPGGPAADSIFARMGPSWSFGVPMSAVVAALLAYAIVGRSPGLAFGGSVILQYLSALACLIPVLSAGRPFDSAAATSMCLWQLGSVGAYTLVWHACRRWLEPSGKEPSWSPSWQLWGQLALFHLAALAMTVWCAFHVADSGGSVVAVERTIGAWTGFAVAGVAAAVWCWVLPSAAGASRFGGLLATAAFLVPIAAAACDVYRGAADYAGYHVLEAGWTVVALAAAWRHDWTSRGEAAWTNPAAMRNRRAGVAWTLTLSLPVMLMSLGAGYRDPQAPWWSAACALGVCLATGVLAVRNRAQRYAHLSVPPMALAAVLLGDRLFKALGAGQGMATFSFLLTMIVVLGSVWLAIDVWHQLKGHVGLSRRGTGMRVHRHVAWGVLGLSLFVFSLQTLAAAARRGNLIVGAPVAGGMSVSMICGFVMALSLALHLLGTLWDRRATYALPALYVWGGLASELSVDALGLAVPATMYWLALFASLQVALTGWLWHQGVRVAQWGLRLGVPEPLDGLRRTAVWLPVMNLVVSAGVLLTALFEVLGNDDRTYRMLAALLPIPLAAGMGFLAQRERKALWQAGTFLLIVVAGVLLGWADLTPEFTGFRWLQRTIRLLVTLAAFTFVFGLGARRLLPWSADWLRALERVSRYVGVGALVTLLGVLLLEFSLFRAQAGVSALSNGEVGVVAFALLAMSVGLVGMALWSRASDPAEGGANGMAASSAATSPFSSTSTYAGTNEPSLLARLTGARDRDELRRMLCVYGAQLVTVLVFAHLFLCRPIWFQGTLRQWWPYIVVAIAFAGVGMGELFQRMGYRVLAEPLQRTGAFLPLIPALGWWIVASRSDYASVLFLIGMVYVIVSVLRRSFISRVMAGLAGNGALWALFHSWEGYSLLNHPQLWLIPPAVSVLAAVHMNRHRMAPTQVTAVRYLAVIVVYLSSSSELFIVGVGKSLWPPLILASVSIAGVMLGIAARVRAFLYLGATFLVLSLVSMVWHASRAIEHVWPWWAFGICSGIAILTVFGLFEKYRDEMRAYVARLREWEK